MSDKDSNKEHQYKINHSIADPNQEAATPVPAATVLLVRDGKTTPEVFMIQRAAKTNFGGAWVFPGGKLDLLPVRDTGVAHDDGAPADKRYRRGAAVQADSSDRDPQAS